MLRPLIKLSFLMLLGAGSIYSPVSSSHAQGQKGEQPKEQTLLRLETELVQLDVVVSDKDGKLVHDLKREDFELFEDGVRQQITHFAIGTARQPASWLTRERRNPAKDFNPSATPVEVRGERYLVLAVDDLHLTPGNLILAKKTLLRFINNQMRAGDQIAIVTTSGNLGLFQQFTNERPVLERAINRLSLAQNRVAASSIDIPRISDYQAELIDRGDSDALELAIQEILRFEPEPSPRPSRGASRTGGGLSARDRAAAQARAKARAIVAENAHYARATLTTLEGVIRSLRALPGRKMVVLLSDGFFTGGDSASKIYDIRRITDAATRAGVIIYSLDMRGLIALPPGGDASEPSKVNVNLPGVWERIEYEAVEAKRDGLNALARDTGGFLIFNTNDLSSGLQRVLEDNEVYYVLAYEPAVSHRDGRFRRIEVRIAGRPELKVRTRTGYFAPSEKEAKRTAEKAVERQKENPTKKEAQAAKEAQIRAGLSALFPLREIPVALAADFIDVPELGSGGLLNAHVDLAGMSFERTNDLYQTAVDLTVMIFDEQGKVASSFSHSVKLDLKPEALERALRQGFSTRSLVPLKPGFYQARIAVREESSGRLGSAAKWFEVSDLNQKQLSLSGIFLSLGDDPLSVLPSASEQISNGQPRPAQVTRRFKRGEGLDFLVFAYNAKADKKLTDLVIQTQVYSGSKLVYAAPLTKMAPPEDDLQRIPYAARLLLESFDPGDYELRLVVIDRLAKTSAQRSINFTVE